MSERYEVSDDPDNYYPTLIGPDDFECSLTEPEDRIWGRDLQPVIVRLNELNDKIKSDRALLMDMIELLENQTKKLRAMVVIWGITRDSHMYKDMYAIDDFLARAKERLGK